MAERERYPECVLCELAVDQGTGVRHTIAALHQDGSGILYVRCARDDSGGAQLVRQFRVLERLCERRGLRARVLIAAVGSGVAERRPDLDQVTSLAEETWCKWVAVVGAERLSRRPLEMICFSEHLERCGAALVSPDVATPELSAGASIHRSR